jgi:hypothetical protein
MRDATSETARSARLLSSLVRVFALVFWRSVGTGPPLKVHINSYIPIFNY